jgi:short-subunit dehydrogenase
MYALITGATSGIGKEISKIIAASGYNLILVGRRRDRLCYMKKYFEKKYDCNVVLFDYDLSKSENCINLFNKTRKYNINLVVNAAGFGKVGHLTETDINDDINMINTNVTALHLLTKLYGGSMKSGNIINFGSIASYFPGPFMAEYAATKAYVLSLGVAANYEFKRQHKNVHVTTVCPGPVSTEFDKVAGSDFAIAAISARKCALAALRGMLKNKEVVVPTFRIKAASKISGVLPNCVKLPVEYYIQTSKLTKTKCKKEKR